MSEKPAVLVARKLPRAVEERIKKDYAPRLNENDKIYSADELVELASGMQAIIPCHTEKLTAEVIAKLPDSVKAICSYSVGYDHIDLEAAKAFYSGAFGWKFQDWGPDYASFEDGRLAGGFYVSDEIIRGGPLVIIYAVDLEAVAAGVRNNGGTIVKEIFSFPGGRRFHFTDPEGYELAVWTTG